MKLTEADLRGIPAANIRVPRDEFIALWTASEELSDKLTEEKIPHWGVTGVILTCRWLADAASRTETGRRYVTDSPVTQRTKTAMPELITDELLAAETMLASKRPSFLIRDRPDFFRATVATLRWAWMRSAPAPYNWLSQASALRTDLAQHG